MKQHIDKLNRLSESHGALQPGKGMASGVIALMLAALCFLGVLAFHFPEYLTTPELRKSYNVDVMRLLLFWSLVLSGALALFNVVMSRARWLALAAFVLIGLSLALGGHKVPVNDFADNTPYIGLDWFILDLLGSTLIFVFIEKAVRAAQGPAGVPAGVADRLPPLPRQPHDRGLRPARDQPARPQAVRLGRQGRHPRLGPGPAVLGRPVPDRPGRRPGAVLDASRVSRGARALAPARGAPQRQEHGLAGRLAPAHPRADHHAHARAGADLRARLQQGSDRRLHRHRRLPGGLQPRQRQRPARAAALRDRHAELPPLAPLGRRRGRSTATTRRTSPSSTTPSAPRTRPTAPGRTATAWSATTCRTASSSSSPFRSSGRAERERRACVRFDVAIVGAGAAGLHCAAIAGQLGCSVVLLDHAEKVAEKIRISGGGRCNFTNLDVGASNFDSENPDFCRSALARYTPRDFIDLVERHGIAWHEKHKGQLFCDGSSAQIIAMLRRRMRRRRRAALAAVPGRVGPRRRGRRSSSPRRAARSRRRGSSSPAAASRSRRSARASGATSSPAGSATGSSSRGRRWSLSSAPDPAGQPFAALAGVALPVRIAAGAGARRAEFVDDLLFTHRGLSGPAALQASTYWRPGEAIAIDLAPGVDLARPWPRRS